MRLRLYDIRDEHHKLQKELAEYLHCTQQTYSRYEIGEVEPPLSVMEALASYYGTSVDYLMGLTDRRTPYPRQQIRRHDGTSPFPFIFASLPARAAHPAACRVPPASKVLRGFLGELSRKFPQAGVRDGLPVRVHADLGRFGRRVGDHRNVQRHVGDDITAEGPGAVRQPLISLPSSS